MNRLITIVFITAIILSANIVSAQDNWLWVRNDSLLNPTGINSRGSNSPYLFDIDNDGDKDLIIGENGITELYYNDGFPAVQYWRRDTSCFSSLQFANCATPAIGDFDLDGQVELVVAYKNPLSPYTDDSLHVYRNIGTPQQPQWSEIYYFFNFPTESYCYPKFIDWDDDADFDLILFRPNDGWIPQYWYFRNQGVPGAPVWNIDSVISGAMPVEACGNTGFDIADFNGDGLHDVIMSYEVCDDGSAIKIFLNEGTNSNPLFNYNYIWVYSSSGFYKNITVADLDFDGDVDIIEGGTSIPLYYHENTGTPQNPAFNEEEQRLGPPYYPRMASITTLDRNNDGDYDVAGSYEYWYWPEPYDLVAFCAFENIGTPSTPKFNIGNWLPYVYSVVPSFYLSSGDITQDGWVDIAYGRGRNIWLLRNIPGLEFGRSGNFDSLNALGGHANQELIDLNSDGLFDLIARDSALTHLAAFENLGGQPYPLWAMNNQLIDGLNIYANYVRGAYLNRDSLIDLVAIIGQGQLAGFLNIGTATAPYFQYDSAIFASLNGIQFLYYDLADFDGDGDADIIANDNGSLTLYQNRSTLSIGDNPAFPHSVSLCRAYPNPFNGQTNISFTLAQAGTVKLAIYDIAGRLVDKIADRYYQAGRNAFVYNAGALSSGVYFYRLDYAGEIKAGKMTLIK